MSIQSGVLFVVATPIGNLDDLSPRALEVLKTVDLIVAEDTRHSLRLMRRFGIVTPLQSLHEHNERRMSPALIQRIKQGQSLALISDAGTPLISDPGGHLVEAAHNVDIQVVPIPGPSALAAALSAAGMPTDRFVFEGFLPTKAAARQQRLKTLVGDERTLVFYEAPHRIVESLADLASILGPSRQAVIAREISKVYESIHRASLAELSLWVGEDENRQRGEFVLVVAGQDQTAKPMDVTNIQRIVSLLADALPARRAAEIASAVTGVSKNRLYKLVLAQKADKGNDEAT